MKVGGRESHIEESAQTQQRTNERARESEGERGRARERESAVSSEGKINGRNIENVIPIVLDVTHDGTVREARAQ
eukprot:545952-Amorphochlora_amoeboformis.AAC.1